MIGKDFTVKDVLEAGKITREHHRIKAARKALRKRLNAYNRKARRERWRQGRLTSEHYAPVLRIKL